MKKSNIKPTDPVSNTNRTNLSNKIGQEPASTKSADIGMYKALFDFNKIYGSILDDMQKNARQYMAIEEPPKVHDTKGVIGLKTDFALNNGMVYPIIELNPSFSTKIISLGLHLAFAKDYTGSLKLDFSGIEAILDKVDFILIGDVSKKRFVRFGSIEDFTIGNGTVVKNFSNHDPYSILETKGLLINFSVNDIDLVAFASDVTNFTHGGVHIQYAPGLYIFGLGFHFDRNQFYIPATRKHSRFVETPGLLPEADSILNLSDSSSLQKSTAYIVELNLRYDLMSSFDQQISFVVDFAQKFQSFLADGLVINGPKVFYEFNRFRFGLGMLFETGRLISPQFHKFYSSNKLRLFINDSTSLVHTQNNVLSLDRKAPGFQLEAGVAPIRGLVGKVTYVQHFLTTSPFKETEDDTTVSENNYHLNFSIRTNNVLIPQIHFAELFLDITHGNYYPDIATFFASWGTSVGFTVQTKPLFYNIALEAGFTYSTLDLNAGLPSLSNFDSIDTYDQLIEFYIGASWGFLKE